MSLVDVRSLCACITLPGFATEQPPYCLHSNAVAVRAAHLQYSSPFFLSPHPCMVMYRMDSSGLGPSKTESQRKSQRAKAVPSQC
jgi:hypothetical protein